jgi:hypothetical protein
MRVGPDVARAQGKPSPIGLGPYGTWGPGYHCILLCRTAWNQCGRSWLPRIPDASHFLEIKDMSSASEQLACVANAEKHLCEQVGPLVARIIEEIENRLDIKIGEVRLTMNTSDLNGSWGGINCVITQADFEPRQRDGLGAAVVADGVQERAGPR